MKHEKYDWVFADKSVQEGDYVLANPPFGKRSSMTFTNTATREVSSTATTP